MNDEPITDAELGEWKALADAAAPGPWVVVGNPERDDCFVGMAWHAIDDEHGYWELDSTVLTPDNVAFIAASRSAMPRLLAEVERLREKCKYADLSDNAHEAVRILLMAHDVPMAAFIDDHVGNAIAQRNEAREVATALVQFTNFHQTPERLAELDDLCKQVSTWGKVPV